MRVCSGVDPQPLARVGDLSDESNSKFGFDDNPEMKAILDSDIWNERAVDLRVRERIRFLSEGGQLEIIVPDTLLRELNVSPLGDVRRWFPVTNIPDRVAVVGHSRIGGARVEDGEIYSAHRGQSQQVPDAVIVDAADTDADVFVSQDRRARERYARMRNAGRSLDYARFYSEVLGL